MAKQIRLEGFFFPHYNAAHIKSKFIRVLIKKKKETVFFLAVNVRHTYKKQKITSK